MNNPSQQKIVANFNQKQIAEKYTLARKLGTSLGFFKYYFSLLPRFKNQVGARKKAFETANLLHFKIFKEYKYSDFDSFRKIIDRNHRKNSK